MLPPQNCLLDLLFLFWLPILVRPPLLPTLYSQPAFMSDFHYLRRFLAKPSSSALRISHGPSSINHLYIPHCPWIFSFNLVSWFSYLLKVNIVLHLAAESQSPTERRIILSMPFRTFTSIHLE